MRLTDALLTKLPRGHIFKGYVIKNLFYNLTNVTVS